MLYFYTLCLFDVIFKRILNIRTLVIINILFLRFINTLIKNKKKGRKEKLKR